MLASLDRFVLNAVRSDVYTWLCHVFVRRVMVSGTELTLTLSVRLESTGDDVFVNQVDMILTLIGE